MADETSSSTPETLPAPAEAFPSESSESHAVPVGVLGDANGDTPIDVVETHQPFDGDHFLAFAISTDVPLNLDHALDQLTTATDLFDVPVLDYHTPSSDV